MHTKHLLIPFTTIVLTISLACAVEEIGIGSGSVDIHNSDSAAVELLISDSPECGLGMHSSLESGSTRDFSVGDNTYVCVGEHPPGVQVEDGGRYEIRGGTLVPDRR
jgi:hypothetical protein